MFGNESPNTQMISLSKFAQGPGECFHDHVVAIVNYQPTNLYGSSQITAPTARLVVERDGAHDRCSAPPSIFRASPSDYQ
jgi:hypothetical protein